MNRGVRSSITCKFGGSSLGDAAGVRHAEAIVDADPRRRYVVVSAPGKRFPEDTKVTDLFYAWHQGMESGQAAGPRNAIAGRFRDLADGLSADFDIEAHLHDIEAALPKTAVAAYLASRGEYLMGVLMAEVLDAQFVDAAEVIRFGASGALDPETYAILAARLSGDSRYVIPGFYGAGPDGGIQTFSRGGSDVTGAVVAKAMQSTVYENWTDVPGIRIADPAIVPYAARMPAITFRELRELSYMGANVLHQEAVFPVKERGIPIHIRSTREPGAPGTQIVAERVPSELVCGIAGRKGFCVINIEKTLLNRQRGFLANVLNLITDRGITVEHVATGIDALSLVVPYAELEPHEEAILHAIEDACQPDRLHVETGLAVIATVGQGMEGKVGMAARLCQALAREGISIEIIDQGSPENNIIVGVEERNYEHAIRAIYDEFATGSVQFELDELSRRRKSEHQLAGLK